MTKETGFFTGIVIGLIAAVLIPYGMRFFGWPGALAICAIGFVAALVHGVRSRKTWSSIFRWNAGFACALPALIGGVGSYAGNPDYPAAKPWFLLAAVLFLAFVIGSWEFKTREA